MEATVIFEVVLQTSININDSLCAKCQAIHR